MEGSSFRARLVPRIHADQQAEPGYTESFFLAAVAAWNIHDYLIN